MTPTRWMLTEDEQKKYIDALADDLAPLRAKAGISQIDLCNLLGISRQTYSAIEGKRRSMTWPTFLSFILFFDYNLETRDMLRSLPAYPRELFDRMNQGKTVEEGVLGQMYSDLNMIMGDLDDEARHAIKTLLLMEYARCKKIPGNVVIKAFDGLTLYTGADLPMEEALRNIKKQSS